MSTDLITPESLPVPAGRINNFWYDCSSEDTVFVFLHGIFSTSRSCWLYEDSKAEERVYWPDLVRRDGRLGGPSVYLAGYCTARDAGDFPLDQCAREVFEALERPDPDGIPPVLQMPVLVFICHSTGGIVARYMLERYQHVFRDKAVGLALIASPSLGSRWANLASFMASYYNQQLGLQLRVNDRTVKEFNGRFRDLVFQRRIPRLFGMEASENKMILREKVPRPIRWLLPSRLKVVTTLSAGQFFGDAKVLPGVDHFSSVKPDCFTHPAHQFLVTFAQQFQRFLEATPAASGLKGEVGQRAASSALADHESGSDPSITQAPPHRVFEEGTTRRLIAYYTHIFVGRSSEIDRIVSLVRTATAGYLHVTGNSGTGKTTLIVNVIAALNRMSADGRPVLLSYLIPRGQTDVGPLLQALISQIAHTLGLQELVAADVSLLQARFIELWQRLMDQASERRPVLLLIDGLDELSEPASLATCLPGSFSDYVHVVVTSRPNLELAARLPKEHIATLATRLELANLNVAEVGQLLAKHIRDDERATQLAPEVERITGGVPLAASLLSRAIASKGETVLNRSGLSTLLEDYLDDEAIQLLRDTAGELERRVIAALVVARGPLSVDELVGILQAERPQIEQALRPVLRCVFSPTRLEFVHPELKSAVARHVPKGDKDDARQRVSRWMKSVIGSMPDGAFPEYVLKHLVDQMIDEHGDDVLFRTVFGQSWRQARHRQTRSYVEYANDLTKTRDYAAEGEPKWTPFCQACYALAQLRTAATSLPSSVILLMARLGDFAIAESYLALDSDASGKAATLAALSHVYQESGNLTKAKETLDQAEQELYGVSEAEERCLILRLLAERYSVLGDMEKARALARFCRSTADLIPDKWTRSNAMHNVIEALVAVRDFQASIDVVLLQEDEYDAWELMAPLSVSLVESGHIDLLLNGIGRLPATLRIYNLKKTLQTLAARGYLAAARRIASSTDDRDHCVAHMCAGLAQQGDIEACLATLREIGVEENGEGDIPQPLLGRLRRRFFTTTKPVMTRAPARHYLVSLRRRDAVKQILSHLRDPADAQVVSTLASGLESAIGEPADSNDFQALANIVEWLVGQNSRDMAKPLAERVAAKAFTLGHGREQLKARCFTAGALGSVRAWDSLIEVAQPVMQSHVAPPDVRDWATRKVCEALARTGQIEKSLAQVESIVSPGSRAITIGTIASVLAES